MQQQNDETLDALIREFPKLSIQISWDGPHGTVHLFKGLKGESGSRVNYLAGASIDVRPVGSSPTLEALAACISHLREGLAKGC